MPVNPRDERGQTAEERRLGRAMGQSNSAWSCWTVRGTGLASRKDMSDPETAPAQGGARSPRMHIWAPPPSPEKEALKKFF